ncbi:Alpha/Beta hydrolase protein [Stachybotrys elegans]|uniref:1-alkyl-2-acetylglycerophosphocholine esterase n=1 Tax=Stachybotrys elegans TaxID=80388 RepID=A0A8K0SHY7_9HYPO|nr:Alpha/Beta hydrolase protein [Stachybotrys elegans]
MKVYTLLAFLGGATAQTLLPGSTGPYAVSMRNIALTDNSRWDPLASQDEPHKRRFMASLFLPLAPGSCEQTTVPYLSPAEEVAWGLYVESDFGVPAAMIAGYEMEYCQPFANTTKGSSMFPVVIFGGGGGGSRVLYSVQARELASQGYFVITTDHPYEAFFVEFPDGSSVWSNTLGRNDTGLSHTLSQIRSDDVIYIIDNLDTIVSDLPINVNTSAIIQYGHSLGGNTAALTAFRDSRVLGALDMDGHIFGPILEEGSDVPFVLLGNSDINYFFPDNPHMWESFHGPKLYGIINGTTHQTFTDFSVLFDTRGIPPELIEFKEQVLGTISGIRIIELITGSVTAFADFVLRGSPSGLKGLDDLYEEFEVYEDRIPGCNK